MAHVAITEIVYPLIMNPKHERLLDRIKFFLCVLALAVVMAALLVGPDIWLINHPEDYSIEHP